MSKMRVLVVDDAIVVRTIVGDVLREDPELEVVGTALNGKIALSKIPQLNPDIVVLDVEMPELDGISTLKEIRKTNRRLPVIMFSSLTEQGAAATIDALSAGASDYVAKPSNVGSLAASQQALRDVLIPKIKSLCARSAIANSILEPQSEIPRPVVFSPRVVRGPVRSHQPIEIVVIGISTGGPNALCEVLPQIPKSCPVPILIVQHMPPMFTMLLAERLDKTCELRVVEGKHGDVIAPGHIYLAPGDYHMTVRQMGGGRCELSMNQNPQENSCRPAVDVLFRSAVETYGPGILGVIMTGMGQDGLKGCEQIRAAGGQIIVQDQESSVIWGMPGFVAKAGLADEVLALNNIAPAIIQRVKSRTSATRVF